MFANIYSDPQVASFSKNNKSHKQTGKLKMSI